MTVPSRFKHRLLLLGIGLAIAEATTWLALFAFPWFLAAPVLAILGFFVVSAVEGNW